MPPSSAMMPSAPSKALRAQASANAPGFIDDGLEPHLHEFIGRHHARHAGPDDRQFLAMAGCRYVRQARRVLDPVIEREREIGAENGYRALVVGVGHLGRVGSRHACTSGVHDQCPRLASSSLHRRPTTNLRAERDTSKLMILVCFSNAKSLQVHAESFQGLRVHHTRVGDRQRQGMQDLTGRRIHRKKPFSGLARARSPRSGASRCRNSRR